MTKIEYTEKYRQGLIKTLKTIDEGSVANCVKWFIKNPSDTRLDDHALNKKMKGKRAFSITNDIRIIYRWIGKNKAQFLNIGRHIEVY